MTNRTPTGKVRADAGDPVPRMVGESDLALVWRFAEGLPDGARLVEFGPWLGGVTQVLAEYGEVHVVDRFIWSEANAAAHPGIAEPGGSFRPRFEALMRSAGVHPQIHETEFKGLEWTGGQIDFCFIDAPRDGQMLHTCLAAIAADLAPEAPVLIKRGLDPLLPGMMAYIEILAGLGVFEVVRTDQPRWCNTIVLRPGPEIRAFADGTLTLPAVEDAPLFPAVADPWGEGLLSLIRIADRIAADDWASAYRLLDQLPPDPAHMDVWDGIADKLTLPENSEQAAWVFATVFSQHNDAAPTAEGAVSPDGGIAWALRAYWANRAGLGRAQGLPVVSIIKARKAGAMSAPARVLDMVHGKRLIEVGTDLGLSAVGYACAGVSAYLGLEVAALTPEMLDTERELANTTYLPWDSLDTIDGEAFDICIVDAETADREDVAAGLARVGRLLAPRGYFLRVSDTQVRRFRPKRT